MITVSQNAGRLAEIRMSMPLGADDLASLQRGMGGIFSRLTGRLIVCADLSAATILPEDLANELTKFFRTTNTRIERAAVVVGGGATFFMQIERLLREGSTTIAPASRPDAAPSVRDRPSRSDPLMAKRIGTDPMLGKRTERRAFRTAAETIAWLDEVLSTEEKGRLRIFLDGPASRR